MPLEGDFHEPVFLEEVKGFFKSLSSRRRAVFFDCNLGGGAHAFSILRELPGDCRYVGFDVPDKFVVGYGLDYEEKYRNLRFIAVLPEEESA